MKFIAPFSDLGKTKTNIAGGKGASLGEMFNAGISVPDGFVVLSSTFERFIGETDLKQELDTVLHSVDHKAIHTLDEASERIKSLILSREIPEDIKKEILSSFKDLNTEYVAVRSSATVEDGTDHAWAGQLESYLNVTDKDLIEKVQHCWASLFTPRAIFYRFEKELHTISISVAVVVQKMVNSEKSGIAFSVHPVTEDRNQLIIEAGFGLGEAIVSGSITPDSYVVEKEPRRIIDINVSHQNRALYRKSEGGNEWKDLGEEGKKQVLNETQIFELSKIILKIENHYGFPCDIEWAYENGKFYIVQSRPITTLSNKEGNSKKITLSKIFSREKTLFYFSMWNDSDRLGWKNFLGHEVRNNLFLIPPQGQKGSVWYAPGELAEIDNILKKTLQENPNLIEEFTSTLDTNWQIIFPYLSDKKKIGSIEEFRLYYKHLVEWWSAMNTAFSIPDMEEVSENTRKLFLSYRTESEKYTEKMNKVLVTFWREHFPELINETFCIAPQEVSRIASGDTNLLKEIERRRNGCFMLNEKIYPLNELNQKLEEVRLALEKLEAESEGEIRGNSAYKGKVSGIVKKITSFKDMSDFKTGEILVTEMTNPDYLPIMKIATAVVTDEGGAICHAAIACRELKIPCIVGTKIATQVLKDGDEVEVDADNGIVKILCQNYKIDLKNYTRLFSFDGSIPYLFSYEFVTSADWLNYLSIGDENSWISYMHNNSIIRANQEGLALYSSKEKYKNFFEELHQANADIRSFIKEIGHRDTLTKEDVSKFFGLVNKYRWHYTRTEFFFTDLAFEKKDEIKEIQENFETFEKLKLDGRKFLNEILLLPDSCLIKFLEKISKQYNISVSDLNMYSPKEIEDIFDGNKLSQDDFKKRSVYIHYMYNGTFINIQGDTAKAQIQAIKDVKLNSVIKGKTAYPGKITAKARVIKIDIKDYHKVHEFVEEMQHGEVLVAESTEPSIILACQKASAIVTNQGGMMSHAAITAREMRIPCIVGTGVATTAIKTGDTIEVNADTGEVTIKARV